MLILIASCINSVRVSSKNAIWFALRRHVFHDLFRLIPKFFYHRNKPHEKHPQLERKCMSVAVEGDSFLEETAFRHGAVIPVYVSGPTFSLNLRKLNCIHSVESPSTVDPQWDVWYWGSKWNLHTVCWSAVGCEWGTTSVYFGITYVCFIPRRLPVFAVEPQYLLQDFLFLSKVSFEGHIQNLQKKFMLV